MKLNLGCGFKRLADWVNVDASPVCSPDQVVDLEALPWPWPDDSAEAVMLSHVLEHLGESSRQYLGIIRELWRVCRPDAQVTIIVPHPRHDEFLNDPTHVRPITAEGLSMFSQRLNRQWIAGGFANTPLGLMLEIDFEVLRTQYLLDEPWRSQLETGQLDRAQVDHALRHSNNVVKQTTVVLRAVKPAGSFHGA